MISMKMCSRVSLPLGSTNKNKHLATFPERGLSWAHTTAGSDCRGMPNYMSLESNEQWIAQIPAQLPYRLLPEFLYETA